MENEARWFKGMCGGMSVRNMSQRIIFGIEVSCLLMVTFKKYMRDTVKIKFPLGA